MNLSVSPRKDIAEGSSKFQQELQTRLLLSAPNNFRTKSNFFDSLKQSSPETMQRRLDSRRHPMTGISRSRVHTASFKHSEIVQEAIRRSHKLNPRILETWLNNTVADSEEFEVPSTVIKQENKQPLGRFGIDRSSLLNAGLPSLEIDRLYQSLFVHSIGFYQLILKVLEHTEKKYTIVTGIWKVFAILLEYCCQLDYQMIITTLNLEKREELEQLENEYKGQISLMEEHEKRLLESINSVRAQLKNVQKDLQKEIEKREELEDELLQRGSGHEEEVAMRLSFESKLNQMYAKQRDLTTKIEQLSEIVAEQMKMLDVKNDQVAKEKKRANDLIQGKIEAEQEMKKMEERQKQLEVINNNLENRFDEAILKIETINANLSRCQMDLSESLNENAQRRIMIDDQKFEIDVCKVQINKLETLIDEYALEKNIYTNRINELESTYLQEYEKNKHFEQEYAVVKESEIVALSELKKFKERAEGFEVFSENLERERDKLKIEIESALMLGNELKSQIAKAQERMEEMNKGRRIVEEMNENLKQKIDEKHNDLIEARRINVEQKAEIENLRSRENELLGEVATLCIKIKSLEKQYETTKETMQEKINNLNDILASEKKIRENWIYRYEEEQKLHSSTTKTLIETEDKLNETIMKCNSAMASLDEKTSLLDKYLSRNKDQFEEILNLKSLEEEFKRKNRTLNVLMGNIEKENKEKLAEIFQDIEDMKTDHQRELERKSIQFEDLWQVAQLSYEAILAYLKETSRLQQIISLKDQQIDSLNSIIEEQTRLINSKGMTISELEALLLSKDLKLQEKSLEIEKAGEKYSELFKEHSNFLNKIPKSLRGEKNPFSVLENKIWILEDELRKIQNVKDSMTDKETQFHFEPDLKDFFSQTEIDAAEFERITRKSIPGGKIDKTEKFVQCSMPELPRASVATSHDESRKELSIKKKVSTDEGLKVIDSHQNLDSQKHLRQQSADSIQRDEEVVTPVNLKSIYKHDEKTEESKNSEYKLPLIGKKQIPIRPPTMPSMLMTTDIKRHLKQANSRRKNESMY
jgi:hypothetical protein